MILQGATFSNIEWIFGLGLMFGLAFLLNFYLEGNIKTFFILLLFFCGFMVHAGILDYWILILLFIGSIFIVFAEISQNRGMG